MKDDEEDDLGNVTDTDIEAVTSRCLFIRDALPSEWLAYSEQLAEAAEAIWTGVDENMLVSIESTLDGKIRITKSFPRPHPYLLLAGFALENVLKAMLIIDEPSLITSGRLGSKLKSHDLNRLAAGRASLRLSEDESNLLATCSEAIPYWGRYPIPLDHQTRRDIETVTAKMRDIFNSLHYRLCKSVYDRIKDGWDSGGGARLDKIRNRKYEDNWDST